MPADISEIIDDDQESNKREPDFEFSPGCFFLLALAMICYTLIKIFGK